MDTRGWMSEDEDGCRGIREDGCRRRRKRRKKRRKRDVVA